jgi:hypothetical protein
VIINYNEIFMINYNNEICMIMRYLW